MKAVKTIIATAVIVFALTTVAMAGVQRLDGGRDVNAAPASATTPAAGHGDSVTLSAQQFAALLRAVSRDGAKDRAHVASHTRAAARAHARAHDQAQTHTHAASQMHAHPDARGRPDAAGRAVDAPSRDPAHRPQRIS